MGTTSVRSLESAWDAEAGIVTPREREATSLYLLPGSEFHVVDALVTNFHVPRLNDKRGIKGPSNSGLPNSAIAFFFRRIITT